MEQAQNIEQRDDEMAVEPLASNRVEYDRGAKLCTVEIDCRVAMAPAGSGNIVSNGVHRYLFAEYDVKYLMRQVRTDEDREQFRLSQERFARELHNHIEDDREVQDLRRTGQDDLVIKRIKDLRDTYTGSPEGCMYRDYRRDLPPFERVTVIKRSIDAPIDVERVEAERANAEAIGAAVARTLQPLASTAGAMTPEAFAAAMTAAMGPLVAQLAAAQAAAKKGG